MEESMVFKIVDISSGAITLALAAILIFLKKDAPRHPLESNAQDAQPSVVMLYMYGCF